MKSLGERISYIEAGENPLSADVGLISGDRFLWLFDVGNDPKVTELLNSIDRPKIAVISHFHADHAGGLSGLSAEKIYLGAQTFKHTGRGEIVRGDIYFDDGLPIHIFELPSSHSPGSVGLEAGDFCFLGDGIYSTKKQGRTVYNAGLLQAEIKKLRSLSASRFLLSHDGRFVYPRGEVISSLEEIWSRRIKNEPYIEI